MATQIADQLSQVSQKKSLIDSIIEYLKEPTDLITSFKTKQEALSFVEGKGRFTQQALKITPEMKVKFKSTLKGGK